MTGHPRPDLAGGTSARSPPMYKTYATLLTLATVEFGRAFQVQGTLAAAAREGVRMMALQNSQPTARATARSVASSLNPALTDAQISFAPAACPTTYSPGSTVTITIRYR